MTKAFKSALSVLLVISLVLSCAVSSRAATEEKYISELRLIYANSYKEAQAILQDSAFQDYQILNENLNKNTDKIGVWLAYKTTTDIDDAITDIAVMQMNGGYTEGNYQAMIDQSRQEYLKMGENYRAAIKYFMTAYDADDFLAQSAYRQLNFYTVVTEGLPAKDIPAFEGKRLGDIFYEDISASELATMFMEGNIYVLDNIRSLLAMGVSYNEDGKHYLQKVGESAALMNADAQVFSDKNYDELAALIAGTILTFGNMFKELAAYEGELNYEDDVFTDLEIKYAEYKSFADRMREVDYLSGKSLYDFCCEYLFDEENLSNLYPLVDALNDGQKSITKVAHYYDVVRYSMTDLPVEQMDDEITKLEETYSEVAFNIYAGVDRTIYNGTFALTSDAYRANAYTESGFTEYLTSGYGILGITGAVSATAGLGLTVWAICRSVKANMTKKAAEKAVAGAKAAYEAAIARTSEVTTGKTLSELSSFYFKPETTITVAGKTFTGSSTCNEVLTQIFNNMYPEMQGQVTDFSTQLLMVQAGASPAKAAELGLYDRFIIDEINRQGYDHFRLNIGKLKSALDEAQKASRETAELASNMSGVTTALYIAGGVLMLYSAITLTVSVYNYYNPDYDDIPLAMVDLIKTADGDRYIKYDVVLEAEAKKDGVYAAGDLNAFKGLRWNALYYTKSYEAGKPLLADEFVVSNNNNKPADKYMAVHRFGEVICFNLNKYNYNEKHSIYLSAKQSDKQKSVVAGVPEVVGSMFGTGFWLIAGGIGAVAGVGGTLATQSLLKKAKTKSVEETGGDDI